jgi:hypothetical protein
MQTQVNHSSEVTQSDQNLYIHVKGLESLVEGLRGKIFGYIYTSPLQGAERLDQFVRAGGTPLGLLMLVTNRLGVEMAGAQAMLDTVRASPEYIEAAKVIEPLLAREKGERDAEAALRQDVQEKRTRVFETEKAAREKALGTVDTDPEVVAARKALRKVLPANFSEPETVQKPETDEERKAAERELETARGAVEIAYALGMKSGQANIEGFPDLIEARKKVSILKAGREAAEKARGK